MAKGDGSTLLPEFILLLCTFVNVEGRDEGIDVDFCDLNDSVLGGKVGGKNFSGFGGRGGGLPTKRERGGLLG